MIVCRCFSHFDGHSWKTILAKIQGWYSPNSTIWVFNWHVVYNCFFCGNWSSNDAPTWHHFACSLNYSIYISFWSFSYSWALFCKNTVTGLIQLGLVPFWLTVLLTDHHNILPCSESWCGALGIRTQRLASSTKLESEPWITNTWNGVLPTPSYRVSQKYIPPIPYLRDVIYERSLSGNLWGKRKKN